MEKIRAKNIKSAFKIPGLELYDSYFEEENSEDIEEEEEEAENENKIVNENQDEYEYKEDYDMNELTEDEFED